MKKQPLVPANKSDPEKVFRDLLSQLKSARARRNLENVNEVCRAIFAGPKVGPRKDYSIASIARALQTEGKSPALATINHPQGGKIYKVLIRAWAATEGDDVSKPPRSTPQREDTLTRLLSKISDLAVRSEVALRIQEGKIARAELNTLKARTTLTIDMRPKVEAPRTSELGILTGGPNLNELEREALEKAVSRDHLKRFNLTITEAGELATTDRRGNLVVILHAGFEGAVLKALGGKRVSSALVKIL